MMHTEYHAQITLGSMYILGRFNSRADAQAWISKQIRFAEQRGLRVRSPRIWPMAVHDLRDEVRRDWDD